MPTSAEPGAHGISETPRAKYEPMDDELRGHVPEETPRMAFHVIRVWATEVQAEGVARAVAVVGMYLAWKEVMYLARDVALYKGSQRKAGLSETRVKVQNISRRINPLWIVC
jgi:hypothetical protein